jgi:outer membrane protein OmpA-like peptidoglycan-associated protein/tetratricopeptide (TPR) repeat protein
MSYFFTLKQRFHVMTRITLLAILLSLHFAAACQTTRATAPAKTMKALDEAMQLSRSGETAKALAATEKVLKSQPDLVDAWLLKANLHTDQSQWPEAEAAYEKAIALKADYYPNALRAVAQTEWAQDKFMECAAHAREFLNAPSANKTDQRVKDLTLRLAENAEFAEGAMKKPVPFVREKLSESINSPDPEYLPSLSADGRYLLYTRRENNRDENYWISEWSQDGWRPARPMDELNTPNLEGAASLSPDGQLMVFSSEGRGEQQGSGSFDIWYAASQGNGKFGKAQLFGSGINTASWDAQPCLSVDGKELFFASNRPGGKGGKDLYVSRRVNGKFAEGVPITALNTAFDEQVPFLHPDGQTLYFTSNGWPGLGDQDIYMARKQPDETWSAPVNLGYPINTKDDEGALFVTADGLTGYYAGREIVKGERHDLYSFVMPPALRPTPVSYVKGRVIDATTQKRIKSKLKIMDLTNKTEYEVTDGADGFLVCLPAGRNYAFYAEKEGYSFFSQHYQLDSVSDVTKPKMIEIALTPIAKPGETTQPAKGAVIVLNNLLFDTGSARLKPESEVEVLAVYNFLKTYADLRIKINGHTDNTGGADANQKLSEARAKTLYDALLSKGITASRMKYQGFGATKPISNNESESGRALNRRTELEIE